jgi:hypothetical protein
VADTTASSRDRYFTDSSCCSLLAVPILRRGTLRAVLMLENRLIRGAFSTERLDAVKLIAGQLAVSLDNTQLYAELASSRARILAAGDQARRRRAASIRGCCPQAGSLEALTGCSGIPVTLDLRTDARLPERVEVTTYYVVSEALTNAAKHSNASVVEVTVDTIDGEFRLSVSDDGVGGADLTRGSGLVGLKDRVEAIGGTLTSDERRESRGAAGSRLLRWRSDSAAKLITRDYVAPRAGRSCAPSSGRASRPEVGQRWAALGRFHRLPRNDT